MRVKFLCAVIPRNFWNQEKSRQLKQSILWFHVIFAEQKDWKLEFQSILWFHEIFSKQKKTYQAYSGIRSACMLNPVTRLPMISVTHVKPMPMNSFTNSKNLIYKKKKIGTIICELGLVMNLILLFHVLITISRSKA